MTEFISTLIQTIAVAAIPVCAAFLIQFLRRQSGLLSAQIESAQGRELLAEVTDAVSTAVAYVSQTYVDSLKKDGVFDIDAQKEAFNRAYLKTVDLLSESALDALGKVHSDLSTYLTSRIEAEVKTQKRRERVTNRSNI